MTLDAEMQAYVAKVDGLYPPDAVDLDIVGQRRVYRDLCSTLARCLKAAGVPAVWVNEPGLVHSYLRARRMSSKARASFARIAEGLGTLARCEMIA